MYVLRIEHPLLDFSSWKEAFDCDPVGRQKMGVRPSRALRPTDDPKYVMIDLELDTVGQAEALVAAMREVWVTWDSVAALIQLGHFPPPGQEPK